MLTKYSRTPISLNVRGDTYRMTCTACCSEAIANALEVFNQIVCVFYSDGYPHKV